MHPRQLERILTVVERTLRKTFPDDCQKRCAYSAFGIRSLLQDGGVEATLIGGDFAAFVMSLKGEKAGVQGFGFGEDQCSHFWVEADGRLIDIAPHFLPRESSYPIVPMPAIAWDLREHLPAYLRYRVIERFPASAMMSSDATIILAQLREMLRQHEHLRVVITSATLDRDFFLSYFGGPEKVFEQAIPATKSFGYSPGQSSRSPRHWAGRC
jgi:hypothetical protein